MASTPHESAFGWHRRRMQKSTVFAIGLLCFIWLGAYYQHNWPSPTGFHQDSPPKSLAHPTPTTIIQAVNNGNIGVAAGQHGSILDDESKASKEESMGKVEAKPHSASSKPLKSTSASLDPSRVALLLETRPLPHLPALLAHFISVLPTPWVFRFVGSPEANALISSSSLSSHIKTGKLVVTELPAKYKITSQESISMTLTDLSFYKDFLAPAEWLLMFQSDSIICAASKHSIDDWTSANYSWVGAPWNMNVKGGNGGLSLRHVPPIIKILEKETRQPDSPWEDRWLCDRLQTLKEANMPGPDIEVQFSVESQWAEKPFGYHLIGSGRLMVADIWENEERRKHILEYCPEVKIILDMELLSEVKKLNAELAALKAKAGKEKGSK